MYKVERKTYKGSAVLSISKTTDSGEYSVISFGLNKAKAILECQDAIKQFVEDAQNSNTNKDTINSINNLSQDQINQILGFLNNAR